ncbi:hypothetical protein [Deinococcus soli (ex Cha et al. 2016)]|uniref:Uncharacterized protein n=2 Tax=Deinococcus soli (ex Cha et al. 2016) TaxID=1309411 RepID=A0ACC6KG46_9DEIO|nr:hypothetical protein [Deinococcus soli (ex Cha et al. 2016)]MDR6218439.1 hypothetical protein [Deinococcus soli (ex Cha et al. 2016)]MDR6329179.1 hypothetical protein [Deinococcus soli (ex Cha et al. 2016)]MDR6751452.1 hypothetical protein [Deinococcus soli (ex Cha et al. 2016)]
MKGRGQATPAQQPHWTAHQHDLMVVCAMGSGGFAKVPEGCVGVIARQGGHDGLNRAEHHYVITPARYEALYEAYKASKAAHLKTYPLDLYGFLITDEFTPATAAFLPLEPHGSA